MNESFDQQPGQSPLPCTGARQTAQSGGSAMSSAARSNVRAAFAARLSPDELANPAAADMRGKLPRGPRIVIASSGADLTLATHRAGNSRSECQIQSSASTYICQWSLDSDIRVIACRTGMRMLESDLWVRPRRRM